MENELSDNLLTPKQVADKFTKEWAEYKILEYDKCTRSQILAWGFRQGYEEARKDLLKDERSVATEKK